MSRTAKQRATAAAIAVFIDALLTQPLSADEMVEETGLHRNTISKIIEAMRPPCAPHALHRQLVAGQPEPLVDRALRDRSQGRRAEAQDDTRGGFAPLPQA